MRRATFSQPACLRAKRLRRLVAAVVLAIGPAAWASETDQHTLPPGREFADLGPHMTRFFYDQIRGAVERTNGRIAMLEREGRTEDAAALRTPQAIADAVAEQFPWAGDMIADAERNISDPALARAFPGKIVAYHPEVTIREYFLPIHPANLITDWFGTAITFRIGNTLLGTDKIGHFTDMGKKYYNAYRDVLGRGGTEADAERKAVSLGTDNLFLSEAGLLGLMTANAYSNGDLAANYAGYRFYRHLTEPIRIHGQLRPPMLSVKEGRWKIAEQVRPDSDFFTIFITDHLNEALNPSVYGFDVRGGLRHAVSDRGSLVIEAYADTAARRRLTQPEFAGIEADLKTFYGADYGHWGGPELQALISTDCFPKQEPAGLKQRDAQGRTALHLAAEQGETQSVDDMLRSGANPNAQIRSNEVRSEDWGQTPLHQSVAHGFVNVSKTLIRHGAEVNAQDDLGATPLHRAGRSPAVEQLLVSAGASLEANDALGRTPLHWAAGDLQAIGITWLLEQGAVPAEDDVNGQTPLHEAARVGNVAAVGALMRFGGDADSPDHMGITPLHRAAASAEPDSVGEMLLRTSDVNRADEFGRRPLHDAARAGKPEAVRELLQAGADAKAADTYGVTPFHLACRSGHVRNAQLLLDAGADVNAATNTGVTPLHEAAILGDLDVIDLLIARGARLDARDHRGQTAMRIAIRHARAAAAAKLQSGSLDAGMTKR